MMPAPFLLVTTSAGAIHPGAGIDVRRILRRAACAVAKSPIPIGDAIGLAVHARPAKLNRQRRQPIGGMAVKKIGGGNTPTFGPLELIIVPQTLVTVSLGEKVLMLV